MTAQPFDELFLHKLEQIRLRANPRRLSFFQGDRLARRIGSSTEFLDFREYAQGDDLRYVDWNVFARSNRLVARQYYAEHAMNAHILIDTSKSMSFGTPSKLDYGLRLAAALAYIGLNSNDRVALGLFNANLHRILPPAQGNRKFNAILKQLSGITAEGRTDMATSLAAYAGQAHAPGPAIVISDLLDNSDSHWTGLLSLARRGFDVRMIHILAAEDLAPPIHGSARILDIETGEEIEITADEKALLLYRRKIEAFCANVSDICREHRIGYQRLTTDMDLEHVLFTQLREHRLII